MGNNLLKLILKDNLYFSIKSTPRDLPVVDKNGNLHIHMSRETIFGM